MSDLASLLEAIRTGQAERLSREQVYDLLGWMAGGRSEVPTPDQDPVLQQMVLIRLDAALFRDGHLDLQAAGVDPSEPADLRKARFRRLASVFHPDRFPALADWLTLRSQAVHTAYGHFKKNPDAAVEMPSPSSHAGPSAVRTPPRKKKPARRPGTIKRAMLQLRHRFGNDRFLPHKLIGGLALIALLPVLNLLLAPVPTVDDGSGTSEPSMEDSMIAAPSPVEPKVQAPAEAIPTDVGNAPDPLAQVPESPTDDVANEAGSEPPARPMNPERADSLVSTHDPDGEETVGKDPTIEPPSGSPDESPLTQAARNALRAGKPAAEDLPSVDAQLAALGLPTDDERLNRRFNRPATGASELSEGPRRQAESQPHEDRAIAARPEPSPADRTGDRVQRADPPVEPDPKEATLAERADSAGPREAGAEVARIVEVQPPGSPAETAPAETPSAARSVAQDEGQADTPSSQQRRTAQTQATNAESEATASIALDAPDAGDGALAAEPQHAQAPPESEFTQEALDPERLAAAAERPSRTPPAETPPASSAEPQAPDVRRSTTETAASPARTEPAPPPGRLALGPLGFHPAGDVLTDFKSNFEAGDILSLRALFGNQRAVDRFVQFIQTSTARAIDMQVHGMQRNGNEWLIELDMQLRSADQQRNYRSTTIRLAQQNDRLRIIGIDE